MMLVAGLPGVPRVLAEVALSWEEPAVTGEVPKGLRVPVPVRPATVGAVRWDVGRHLPGLSATPAGDGKLWKIIITTKGKFRVNWADPRRWAVNDGERSHLNDVSHPQRRRH